MQNIELGIIAQLFRYPVKSMRGLSVNSATLGFHGLAGDRRFAFRRIAETGGFPWLTAGRMPSLLLYQPLEQNEGEAVPTHVQTPEGRVLELRSEELRQELSQRFGKELEVMQLQQGIYDEASVSVISASTIQGIAADLAMDLEVCRFRPNILLETKETRAFCEDDWVGGTLVFGDPEQGPAIHITLRDFRCNMINLDPDTVAQNPAIFKAVVQKNEGNAGVYATVVRTGELTVGQKVTLQI